MLLGPSPSPTSPHLFPSPSFPSSSSTSSSRLSSSLSRRRPLSLLSLTFISFVTLVILFLTSPTPCHARSWSNISVSGISSGAYMAVQMHVAFSDQIDGSGVVAGGPYYSSQGNVCVALDTMDNPHHIDVDHLVAQTYYAADLLSIDSPSKLAGSRSFIFAGKIDTTVNPGVSFKLIDYFNRFNVNIRSNINQISAAHAFPTNNYGHECSYLGPSYINNCNIDTPYEILKTIYPWVPSNVTTTPSTSTTTSTATTPSSPTYTNTPLSSPQQPSPSPSPSPTSSSSSLHYDPSSLFTINQASYIPTAYSLLDPSSLGIHQRAYVYIPLKCRSSSSTAQYASEAYMSSLSSTSPSSPTTSSTSSSSSSSPSRKSPCPIHVVFHGCQQTLDHISTEFVINTGYLPLADQLNIIVLFPQSKANLLNPKGCFDWWGFSGMNFATQYGAQMGTTMNMIQSIKAHAHKSLDNVHFINYNNYNNNNSNSNNKLPLGPPVAAYAPDPCSPSPTKTNKLNSKINNILLSSNYGSNKKSENHEIVTLTEQLNVANKKAMIDHINNKKINNKKITLNT